MKFTNEKQPTRQNRTGKKRWLPIFQRCIVSLAIILTGTVVVCAQTQVAAQYPPLGEYLMPKDSEVALARSAA